MVDWCKILAPRSESDGLPFPTLYVDYDARRVQFVPADIDPNALHGRLGPPPWTFQERGYSSGDEEVNELFHDFSLRQGALG